DNGAGAEAKHEGVNAGPEPKATTNERGLEPFTADPSIPAGLEERLNGRDSAERAAALADLAELGTEESFRLITRSFDDPSIEVRNAAARALRDLHADVAASFTRALREASPERRRKIGAAIAGSGLAADAINSLAGEGRDRTYDAFSILFLMAKAGEVQPLINAIDRHDNLEVRLTAAKLIGLSNQQQVFFFPSRRRHTRLQGDWSSDVCSSD